MPKIRGGSDMHDPRQLLRVYTINFDIAECASDHTGYMKIHEK